MNIIKRKPIIILLIVCLLFPNLTVLAESKQESKPTIIQASDYGVDPSGKDDSVEAIYKALDAAKEASSNGDHVVLKFDKGIYHLHKENAAVREVHTSNTDSTRFPEKHIGILIEDQENLTIDGGDSQFIINGDMMALAIMQSENITVENLNWDYNVPTTSEMTVIDFDEEANTIDYFIPEYFNYKIDGKNIIWESEDNIKTGEKYWSETNAHNNYGISVLYPDENMGRNYHSQVNPFTNAQEIKQIDDSRVRISYNGTPAFDIVTGMNFQLVSNAVRPTAGAFIWESSNIDIINTKISYMHGFGFLVQMAENVTFDGVDFESDIETGKNTTSYADGIHVSGAKGKIEIKNSNFNNTHDDPINIHGTFTRVEEVIDDYTVKLKYIHAQQGGFPQFYEGDKVLFYTRDTLESIDSEFEYTVESVEGPSDDNLKEMIVKFEEKVPEDLMDKIGNEPKFVAENITYTPEILIKNNTFKNVFTRMILVTSRKKVVIEDNYFDAPSMPTLFFSNDSDEWYESGPIRDLEIRNNVFNIRSLGRTWWKYSPAIYFHPVTKGAQFPDKDNPIHKNILIEDNTFYLESDGALRAESVENLTFRNNEILRLDPDINLELTAKDTISVGNTMDTNLNASGNSVDGVSLPNGPENNSGSVANVLEFKDSKNVIVENNSYDDGLKKNVLLEGMNEEDNQITDDLTVLTSRENTKPSNVVSNIKYVSEDPEIASIDSKGIITGQKIGTTNVYAYYNWNKSLIKSNVQEVTVTGEAEDEVELNIENDTIILDDNHDAEEIVLLNEDIELSDVEFTTEDTDVISVTDNKITGIHTGVAKVTAKYGKVTKDVLVVVNISQDQKVLNTMIDIEDRDSDLKILENNSVTINRKGNNDLWGHDNTLSNLITFNLNHLDKDNFTGIVTLTDLPKRSGSSWDSVYFLLMKEKENGTVDRDNYISIGKRAHSDGFAYTRELNAQGEEFSTGNVDENDINEATFAIEKIDENITLYSIVEDEINEIESFDVSSFGDEFKLAIGGWGDLQDDHTFKASNIKIANGNIEAVLNEEELDIEEFDTADLEISDLVINELDDKGEDKVLQLDYEIDQTDTDVDRFIALENNGKITLSEGNEVTLSKEGKYQLSFYVKSKSGKISNVLQTDYEYIKNITEGIYVNGIRMVDGDSLDLPDSIEKVFVEDYTNNETSFVDVTDTDSLEVGNQKVYLNKIKSNQNGIEDLSIKKYDLQVNNPGKNVFHNTDIKDNNIDIDFMLEEDTLDVQVVSSNHRTVYPVDRDGDNASVNVPLYNGVNSFMIETTAEDNVSKKQYNIHIIRYAKIDKGMKEISLDGELIAEFNPSTKEYDIDLQGKREISIDSVANDVNATVTLTHNKISSEINRPLDVKDGDQIVLGINHENGLTKEHYTLNVYDTGKSVDTTDLEDLITEIKAVDESNYTAESIKALQDARQQAEDLLLADEFTQAEVDETLALLQEAFDGLVEVEETPVVDTTDLESLITKAKAIDESNYTTESIKALQDARQQAEDLLSADEFTQAEVDEALADLQAAIDALEEIEEVDETPVVDTTDLEDLITEIKAVDESDYTAESIKALQDARQQAEDLLSADEFTQAEVDESLADLQAAIDALEEIEEVDETPVVDTTDLEKLIEKAESFSNQDAKYTKKSLENLQNAIKAAVSELDSLQTESELTTMMNSLQDALDQLVKKEADQIVEDLDDKDSDQAVGNDHGENNELPKTATSMYNWMSLGLLLLGLGLFVRFFVRKRKVL